MVRVGRLLSSKASRNIFYTGAGIVAAENYLPDLPKLNKTVKIRCDNIKNFEYDLFRDLDMLRFIKIVVPISSVNPISLGVDVALRLGYTLDMITDIREDDDIDKIVKFFSDAKDVLVDSIIRFLNLDGLVKVFGVSNTKASANFTIFTPPDDIIWPEILFKNNTMYNITESPYYLSKELILRYAKAVYDPINQILTLEF